MDGDWDNELKVGDVTEVAPDEHRPGDARNQQEKDERMLLERWG